ncbi:MAG: polysaccharide biosynthesis protein, partial [Pseudomonadota bacterium]
LALFEIDRELREMPGDARIHAVLGSVTDQPLVEATMKERGINIVLHAAAYKHVPLVQHNALEGIKNNVLGTKCVADAARAVGAERFILVSTDKAVRPSSVMGASKRFAELLVQDLATRSKDTRFSMVRFGNVLNSSGSVIPLFHEQISRGGPVTLTHADVTRFFMTISEA